MITTSEHLDARFVAEFGSVLENLSDDDFEIRRKIANYYLTKLEQALINFQDYRLEVLRDARRAALDLDFDNFDAREKFAMLRELQAEVFEAEQRYRRALTEFQNGPMPPGCENRDQHRKRFIACRDQLASFAEKVSEVHLHQL